MPKSNIDLVAAAASLQSNADPAHLVGSFLINVAAGTFAYGSVAIALWFISYGLLWYTYALGKGIDYVTGHTREYVLAGLWHPDFRYFIISLASGVGLLFLIGYKIAIATSTWPQHFLVLLRALGFWCLFVVTVLSSLALLLLVVMVATRLLDRGTYSARQRLYSWRRKQGLRDQDIDFEDLSLDDGLDVYGVKKKDDDLGPKVPRDSVVERMSEEEGADAAWLKACSSPPKKRWSY